MNSAQNGLGMRKTGVSRDRVNRINRMGMRFSPKFITL